MRKTDSGDRRPWVRILPPRLPAVRLWVRSFALPVKVSRGWKPAADAVRTGEHQPGDRADWALPRLCDASSMTSRPVHSAAQVSGHVGILVLRLGPAGVERAAGHPPTGQVVPAK